MPDWFESIFGFREAASRSSGVDGYLQSKKCFSYDPSAGILCAPSGKFHAGFFETPSLEELRAEVEAASLSGSLSLEEIISDITTLHVLPENCGALFQAASQFNALEHTSERGLPEHGITCYAHDRTQGPACATACAPGTVVRNYFAFGDKGQSREIQVENLADVEELLHNKEKKYFRVISGYTMANPSGLRDLSQLLAVRTELQEDIRKKLRVGIQWNTQVVSSNFGSKLYEGKQQLVTQVYASAVSVSYSGCRDTDWELFATLILESAYESTLCAAVLNAIRNKSLPGSRKVFLTALGGGVFGNDMKWIQQAIQKACSKFQHFGLQVYLVSYGCRTREFIQLEKGKWGKSKTVAF